MTTLTPVSDECVVVHGATWATYEAVLAARGESRRPRLAYREGVLELMSPGSAHEWFARLSSHLVAALVDAWGLDMADLGSTTYKDEAWAKGFEADATFYVRTAAAIRGPGDIDVRRDPPPDILVEVDITRSSIDKLSIYAQFGVAEVWRHDGRRATILVRNGEGYAQRAVSEILPPLTAGVLTDLLAAGRQLPLPQWLAQIREWAGGAQT